MIQKNPDSKISLSKSDREPTLPEKMDIVNKWFASRASNGKSFKQSSGTEKCECLIYICIGICAVCVWYIVVGMTSKCEVPEFLDL